MVYLYSPIKIMHGPINISFYKMFENLKERLLWRRCGWEGIVKMGLKRMEGHTYSSLANDRGKWEALVNTVMNL